MGSKVIEAVIAIARSPEDRGLIVGDRTNGSSVNSQREQIASGLKRAQSGKLLPPETVVTTVL